MSSISLTFSLVGFPSSFSGKQEDFKSLFVRQLVADANNNFILSGRIGGATPPLPPDSPRLDAWADRQSWKTLNAAGTKYFYNTIAAGNEDFLVRLDGGVSKARTILLQDKSGIAATTDDLYIPRQTYPLAGSPMVIDWDASDTFYQELDGDTIYAMINSRHGQEIYLAIMNPSTYTVFFTQNIGFMGGVQPTQTKFISSSLTDVSTQNGSKLIRSNMAAFVKSDEGMTVTTAGNTPIPASTTIVTVLSPTHALLSNAAVADGTNVTVTMVSRSAIGRTDLWIFKNVGGSIYGRVVQGYPGLLRTVGAALPATIKAIELPLAPAPPEPTLEPPVFDPQPGHENLTPGDLTINIMVSAPAVAIRYTTDGSIPTATTGLLVDDTVATYTLAQGNDIELVAIAVAEDNSVSTPKRATYNNVYTIPDTTATAPIDDASTGVARLDQGAEGGLMPTKIQNDEPSA